MAYKCPTCQGPYPSFHICLKLDKKLMRKVEDGYERDANGEIILDEDHPREPKPRPSRAKNQNLTHREAIAAGVKAKFDNDPKRIERDKELVRLYKDEGLSVREVAAKAGLAYKTVQSALHRAVDAGELTMRPAKRRKAA